MKLPAGYQPGVGVVKATAHGGLGERLMKGMGWEKGQGLGKNADGIKQAIEVKKKDDNAGVGGNNSYKWEEKWWEQAFETAALTINTHESDSSDSDSDDDSDDGGAAPLQNNKQTKASYAQNRDGTLSTGSIEELKLLKQLSKGGKLAAGRFGGRDGKLERIRAQEAKQAAEAASKLGLETAATRSDKSDTTSEAQCLAENDKAKKKSKKAASSDTSDSDSEQPPAKKQRIVIEPKVAALGPAYKDFKPTPLQGWWGCNMFISAGCLEGLTKKKKDGKNGFTEDDQEKIYRDAQAAKRQGRQALGQSTRTVKVGGVAWTGNKVSFAEDDEEDKDTAKKDKKKAKLKSVGSSTLLDTVAVEDDDGGKKSSKKSKLSKDKKRKQSDDDVEEEAEEKPEWLAELKWKKIATKVLSNSDGGRMKFKALQTEVATLAMGKLSHIKGLDAKQVKEVLTVHIQASSKFVVDGKSVQLKQ